jgi:hypothetical protein
MKILEEICVDSTLPIGSDLPAGLHLVELLLEAVVGQKEDRIENKTPTMARINFLLDPPRNFLSNFFMEHQKGIYSKRNCILLFISIVYFYSIYFYFYFINSFSMYHIFIIFILFN